MANFFDSLMKKGKIIDDGVRKLDELWETPLIFISKYGDRVDEASKHLENFLESIKDIHDELIEDNQPRLNYVSDVNRFLNECQTIYEEMKQQTDEIKGLLMEFGYETPAELNESKEEREELSIVDPELLETLAIADPYEQLRSTKIRKSDEENISPNKIKNEKLPKFIATPVIKSLADIKTELSIHNPRVTTPLKGAPQEPVYSPYYYKK